MSGLSPFTSYTSTVSVLEADSDQPGQASPPVSWTTAPAAPSPVLNINTSVTDSKAELTWDPPVKLNGELCDYLISVDQAQAQRVREGRVVLDNLLSYTSYEVRLAACVRTRAGSVCCAASQAKPQSAPRLAGQQPRPPLLWHLSTCPPSPSPGTLTSTWRLRLTSEEEEDDDNQENVLEVAGEMMTLTVDIDSLEEDNACSDQTLP